MGLPYMQFYTGDWLRDTRTLSCSAKGAWIDILCAMWVAPTKGELRLRSGALARLVGESEVVLIDLLDELSETGVADIDVADGYVTIQSRRMIREAENMETEASARSAKAAKAARERWRKHTAGQSNGDAPSNAPSNAPSMPQASGEQCLDDAIPDTTVIHKEESAREAEIDPSGMVEVTPRPGTADIAAVIRLWQKPCDLPVCIQLVSDSLVAGATLEEIRRGITECIDIVKAEAPGKFGNRKVPHGETFFRKEQWRFPEDLKGRWDKDDKPTRNDSKNADDRYS